MRSFSLAPGLVSLSQIGVMIGSHHAGDSTMVPKSIAELGRALCRDGHGQAIRSGLRSLDAKTDAAERVHSGRLWKDEAVGLDGIFVRHGKELCRSLSGMSDPGPDVTIDLSSGNPCP